MPDVEKHIRWEKHRKIIKDQAYFPKFRKDSIYKIGNNFYCEICNLVLPDINKTAEHIKTDKHKKLKSNPETEAKAFIGQFDSGYVIINKVILNSSQWNSIVDGRCHLCEVDVQHPDEHIGVEDHVVRLIQAETTYEGDRYYRKVNENYHCFTCKKVFSTEDFENHWSTCENYDVIDINKLKAGPSTKSKGTVTDDILKVAELEKKLVETLHVAYNIDEENNIAICKYCSEAVAINFKTMITHVKDQHNKPEAKPKGSDESSEDEVVYQEVPDYGKRRSELSQYGKKHSIKLNHNGGKGLCLLCDKYISAHKSNFKAHIKGAIHQGHLVLLGLKEPKEGHKTTEVYQSKSILDCSITYSQSEKMFSINNDVSFDVNSFFFIKPVEKDPHFKKAKCFLCDEYFPQGKELEHCGSPAHRSKFLSANVVKFHGQGEPSDFIREIRTNLFHCGYCNQTLPFLEQLRQHCVTDNHILMQEEHNNFLLNTVPIDTDHDDAYTQLLNCAFDE
ncbi:uncharacterized protein LOC113495220 [Trichoplusia ni]|uniref:Uncharacterized protein LOC113495220 n=1 Tax=Trichoplusia ni TaxID=7111 RepID=A0A7E5VMV4_TRINI|nr:uncharacterized protein LOC113495220 [Trichoplusia ni]